MIDFRRPRSVGALTQHEQPSTLPAALAHDYDVVRRVLDGDEGAATTLYDAHAPRVHTLAFRRSGDDECARDLTQDALIRVFASLRGFRGDCALSTWVFRIADRVIVSHLRREASRSAKWDRIHSEETVCAQMINADPLEREHLRVAVGALPEIYRQSIILHDVQGYTHREIADALGLPVGTSKCRLTLARRKLRVAMRGCR